MKNLLLLIIICALSTSLFGQGNLQFNQVKLVSTIETVPTGKVWKVESSIFSGGAPFSITSYSVGSMSYFINGNTCFVAQSGASPNTSNNNSPVKDNAFPFWIPAGTTLASGTNMRYLSVLEFNIVP